MTSKGKQFHFDLSLLSSEEYAKKIKEIEKLYYSLHKQGEDCSISISSDPFLRKQILLKEGKL